MATLSMLSKVPISFSSARKSGTLLRSASATRPFSLVVPRSRKGAKTLATCRLSSQFHGAKLDCAQSVAREVKRGKSWSRPLHGLAVAYTGDEPLQKSEGLDSLKASQIKKVRVASFLTSELN